MLGALFQIGGLGTALVAGATDYRTGKMPNVMTLGSLVAALVSRWWLEGHDGLLCAAFGMMIVAAVPLGLFLFTKGKAIGGGDVKALAALGAWLGPVHGLEAEMIGFVVLALYATAREFWFGQGMLLLKRSVALLVPSWRPVTEGADSGTMVEVRFGPSLAVGTLIVCASSWSQLG